ncbi:MAG: bifunctional phosphoglucose/phosphomannose isomerase [Candidatus Thorarchaeota archaeon]|nr:MAG: bifunctional phosphoglucose/phosphomannose isomerase [Candidatus Thorarchaeota archaeon]
MELEGIDLASMRSMVLRFPELLVAKKPDIRFLEKARRAGESGISGICFVGMGGSSIVGEICRGLLIEQSNVPILTVRDYSLPKVVTKKWAVMVVSYSGDTEETLACFEETRSRGAKIFVITTGGTLAERAQGKNIHVVPKGLQPRAALPLMFSAMYPTVAALLSLETTGLDEVSASLRQQAQNWGATMDSPSTLAEKLKGSVPLFMGWKHLVPIAYRAKCQMNENAKTVAFHGELPEADHNEIEAAMSYSRHSVVPVFLRSCFEESTIKRRFDVTSEVLSEAGCESIHLRISTVSPLEESLAMTHYLDMTSVELADSLGIDPLKIDRIAHLKRKLASDW